MNTRVSRRSKQIRSPCPQEDKQETQKKYQTFDKQIMQAIVGTFRQAAANELGRQAPLTNQEPLQLLKEKNKIGLVNEALKITLTQHTDIREFPVKLLRKWRRTIKSWLGSLHKPETRGGVLVPADQLEKFNTLLMEKFEALANPSYEGIREGVLSIFKEIGKEVAENRCSKHWFYDHLKKNKDVQKAWNNIRHRIEEEDIIIPEEKQNVMDAHEIQIKMEEDIRSLSTAATESAFEESQNLENTHDIHTQMEEETPSPSIALSPFKLFEEAEYVKWNFREEITLEDYKKCEF